MPDILQSHRCALLCLGLAVATAAVYWPVRHFEFVNYDDHEYVTGNPHIHEGVNARSFVWAFTTNRDANWFPLTWLSHMADWQMFGSNAGGHHRTNVLFHMANTVLLFLVFRRMTAAPWRSAFVAGLFAWHPLHVESVAWVSERKDVLSAFFWMSTMWAYVRYAEQPKAQSAKSKVFYGLALVFFTLGLMAKPMLVTLPFALLLLDYWPLGRTKWARAVIRPECQVPPGLLVKEKLPFFVLAAVSCIITYHVQQGGGAVAPLAHLPLGPRLANAVVSYVRYLGKTVWPVRLAAFYPPQSWPWTTIIGAGILLAFVSVFALWRARSKPQFIVGWLWYLGALVPVIGLVQVGSQSMADRYTYLPSIGLFALLAWAIPSGLLERCGRKTALAAAAVLLGVSAMVARSQLKHWRNSEMLFRHALEVTANNFVAHFGLGQAFSLQGKETQAIAEYREALRIFPDYVIARNGLGKVLADQRKIAEAVAEFAAALRVDPDYADAHMNLGLALVNLGHTQEAISEYREAIRIEPDNVAAHNNLGNALASEGKFTEAIAEFTTAMDIDPDCADAHVNLGLVLAGQGRTQEAISEYQQALRINPGSEAAHNNLGNALAGQGQLTGAVAEYEEAVRIKPRYVEARMNLGLALARLGKISEAISQYHEALRISPENAMLHNDLGVALSRQGKIGEAGVEWQTALRINPDYVEARYNLGLALVALGKIREAITEYRSVVQRKSDWPPVLERLAWLLATDEDPGLRDGVEAVRLAERLCEITGQSQPKAMAVLAAAYAEAGRFPDAVRVGGQALELARASGQQELVGRLQQQLVFYREGHPFHARLELP